MKRKTIKKYATGGKVDNENPMGVNRAGKSDRMKTDNENPMGVNRAGKSNNENPMGVNRSGKSNLPQRTSDAPKPRSRSATPKAPSKSVTFKGNWKGAAPSEMQARGGARINRGGGIFGALKNRSK